MFAVLLTVHIVACIAMIATILLQRSEGGGLGLGTGGGVGGLMTGRGAANALTRTTVIFAAIFITTSITLVLMGKWTRSTSTILPTSTNGSTLPTTPLPTTPLPGQPTDSAPAPAQPSAIPVPSAPTPAAPASGAAQPAPQPSPPPPSGGGN